MPPLAPASLAVRPGEEVLLAAYGESEVGRDSGKLRAVLATLSGVVEKGFVPLQDGVRRSRDRLPSFMSETLEQLEVGENLGSVGKAFGLINLSRDPASQGLIATHGLA